MKILLRADSSDPHYDAQCQCAVLDVTPALLKRIGQRLEIARQAVCADGDLYELSFWGYGPDFYDCDVVEACAEAATRQQAAQEGDWSLQFDNEGLQPVPRGIRLSRFIPQGTERRQEVIRCHLSGGQLDFELVWTAVPKHADISITTHAVTWQQLETFAKAQPHRRPAARAAAGKRWTWSEAGIYRGASP